MISGIQDILSKEVALGLGLYFAIAYLAAGPISARIAERDHLPACITNATAAGQQDSDAPPASREALAREVYRQALDRLPGPMRQLIGDPADAMLGALERAKRAEQEAVARRAPDRCRCRIALALAETRTDWALYVGSLKLYRPQPVDRFGDLVTKADPQSPCERSA